MAITSPVKQKNTYRIRFVVRGIGAFPLDMLRHDRCHFTIGTDAQHAEDSLCHRGARDSYFYVLESHRPLKAWLPTSGRWRSFGFEVVELQSDREFESDLCLRPA